MTTSESVAAIEYSIRARFEDICRQLRESLPDGRREKPIGYWALGGDRRLPYALLERRVSEIVNTPFKEIAQTRAIGKKKLAALLVLLERVRDEPYPNPAEPHRLEPSVVAPTDGLAVEAVSESHWEAWRDTVRRWHLSQELLGRLAPSLRLLPTVIWDSPLATYLDIPLADLRSLKTHGDKRVRNVLEVFFHIHQILGGGTPSRHLSVQVLPSFAVPIEQWIFDTLEREELPALQDLRQNLVLPLLNQVELDSDETVGRLLAGRLGVESPPESVIEQAERMQVTRARVYQLLDHAARIVRVRWPAGRWQIRALVHRLYSLPEQDERTEMLRVMRSVLFPDKSRTEAIRKDTLATATG